METNQPFQYIKYLRNGLENAHKTARDNLKAAQFRQKRDYDVKLNHRIYNKGDIVYRIDSATKIGENLESFFDITGETEEIGFDVEHCNIGLGKRPLVDDRHIVTNPDSVNMFLDERNTNSLNDTFLYAIDDNNYGGRIRNRPKYLDDYDLSDMF
ncbi:unnamed protein product [Mytilus coruscus]|uniref:Uncharacterized protein n=1 Tax=Mytilus coruscus TaxID=42192 RepID=A0A6J8C2T1_MYTCO|nr:unnamed protein product [Mytilus coruscus]